MGRIQRTVTHETGDLCQAALWDSQNRAQHGTVSREPAHIRGTAKGWISCYGRIFMVES